MDVVRRSFEASPGAMANWARGATAKRRKQITASVWISAVPGRVRAAALRSQVCSAPAAFFMLSSGSQAPSSLAAASAASWAAMS